MVAFKGGTGGRGGGGVGNAPPLFQKRECVLQSVMILVQSWTKLHYYYSAN